MLTINKLKLAVHVVVSIAILVTIRQRADYAAGEYGDNF